MRWIVSLFRRPRTPLGAEAHNRAVAAWMHVAGFHLAGLIAAQIILLEIDFWEEKHSKLLMRNNITTKTEEYRFNLDKYAAQNIQRLFYIVLVCGLIPYWTLPLAIKLIVKLKKAYGAWAKRRPMRPNGGFFASLLHKIWFYKRLPRYRVAQIWTCVLTALFYPNLCLPMLAKVIVDLARVGRVDLEWLAWFHSALSVYGFLVVALQFFGKFTRPPTGRVRVYTYPVPQLAGTQE